jgi:hypothetical protein
MRNTGVKVLIGVAVLAGLVVLIRLTAKDRGPQLTRANILKVKRGMTEEEVRGILGWYTRHRSYPKLTDSEIRLAEATRPPGVPKTKIANYNRITQTWQGRSPDAAGEVVVTVSFQDGPNDATYRVTEVKAEGIELYKVIGAVDVALVREATGVVARVTNNSGGELKDITVQVWGYRVGDTRAVKGETHLASWPAGGVARVELGAVDQAELVLVNVSGDAAPVDENALLPRVRREWRSLKIE